MVPTDTHLQPFLLLFLLPRCLEGGCAILTEITYGLTIEMAALFVVAIIGLLAMTSDIGLAFYITYLSTAGLLIIVLTFFLIVFSSNNHDPHKLGKAASFALLSRLYSLSRGDLPACHVLRLMFPLS
ncbi:unnamed protein product [Protopolystoma xenopodis]|uniref:NADH:ubiquinone reductase (H(+)-translocating) n=1 Tax=Protopolystoma xenopodis TaxID=117903 RepID=A0A448WUP5_9PLAT|nr:unnamed protein product [Protopolystoma xenopodis]